MKATDALVLRAGVIGFPFRIARPDLLLWWREKSPVVLIVFDAKKTKAYWLYIQQYFAAIKDFNIFAAGETITVHMPVANRVNPKAMRKFARFRDQVYEQKEGPFHA